MALGTNRLVGTLVGATIAAGGTAAQGQQPAPTVDPDSVHRITGGSVQLQPVDVLVVPGSKVSADAAGSGAVVHAPAVRARVPAPVAALPDMDTPIARFRVAEAQRTSPDPAVYAALVDELLTARQARNTAGPSARIDPYDARIDNKTLEMGNYRKAAEEGNFYLRGFNYLFIMYKPAAEGGKPRALSTKNATDPR